MTNKLLVLMMAAAAGCGGVSGPGSATGDDDGSGSAGSGMQPDGPDQHAPGTLYGRLKDERGDTIDFSSGVPVHTHAGVNIQLEDGTCPAVYKYAYLTSVEAPRYGSETTPNPIEWHVQADPTTVDPSSTAYRVRDAQGGVLLDWTAMLADANGVYTIDLYRDGVHPLTSLGLDAQKMYIDARFRTLAGDETTHSGCWDYHPMAAPLHVGAPAQDALYAMSLPANSPISTIVNDRVAVMAVPLEQQTAEPIELTVAAATPTGTMTKTIADAFVNLGEVTPPVGNCDDGGGDCDHPSVTPTFAASSGTLAGTWQLVVEDDVDGHAVCQASGTLNTTCTLPGRAAGAPPHGYHARFYLAQEASLSVGAGMGEFTSGTVSYTGAAPVTAGYYHCDQLKYIGGGSAPGLYCVKASQYAHIIALDKAHFDLGAIELQLETYANGEGTGGAPSYLAAGALSYPASSWDAGDEGLMP